MILFPAIDLKEGLVVRLEQGDMARATVFDRDPAAQAQAVEAQGFKYLHIVDLDGAFAGQPVNRAAVERILQAARSARADAIHPGYGLLSENASFAQACLDAGLIFIGPRPDAIRLMGDKQQARRAVQAPGFFEQLSQSASALVEGLTRAAHAAGVPFSARSVGGMFGVYFSAQAPGRS